MLPPIQDMATIINSRGVTLTSPPPRRKHKRKKANANQAVVASIDRDIASFPMADQILDAQAKRLQMISTTSVGAYVNSQNGNGTTGNNNNHNASTASNDGYDVHHQRGSIQSMPMNNQIPP